MKKFLKYLYIIIVIVSIPVWLPFILITFLFFKILEPCFSNMPSKTTQINLEFNPTKKMIPVTFEGSIEDILLQQELYQKLNKYWPSIQHDIRIYDKLHNIGLSYATGCENANFDWVTGIFFKKGHDIKTTEIHICYSGFIINQSDAYCNVTVKNWHIIKIDLNY